jgi:hypothetical protein
VIPIGKFALAYAEQTVRDHAALVAAVKAGRIKALVEDDLRVGWKLWLPHCTGRTHKRRSG